MKDNSPGSDAFMDEVYRQLVADYGEKVILAEMFAAQAKAIKDKIEATKWFAPFAKEIAQRSALHATDEFKKQKNDGDDKKDMQKAAE